jgi:hypothetical protein
MPLRRLITGVAIVFCMQAPATGEMFKIDNPASNIYNPATQMNDPNPLSTPTQPIPQSKAKEASTTTEPAKQIQEPPQTPSKPTIPHKRYKFKTVKGYINAAKKAFNQDNYIEFLSITEDALRRINAGTLKASMESIQKLNKYKVVGYRLLDNNAE